MHTVKAAEPNRLRLEGLAYINSKKWDKGVCHFAQDFYVKIILVFSA